MKRILSISIILCTVLLSTLTAFAEEERQIYINPEMNMIFHIDNSTMEYAQQGNVLLTKETIYLEPVPTANSTPVGYITAFYAIGDISVFKHESATEYEDVLKVVKKYATPIMVFSMTDNAQVQIPTEFAYMESQVLKQGEKIYRAHKITNAAYNMLDGATRTIADEVLYCFVDLAKSVEITMPSSDQALGMFDTTDIYGTPRNAQLISGHKLTMVNVWATYCAPCLEEMPALAQISDEYSARDVQVVGIVSDVLRRGDEEGDELVMLAREIAEKTGASRYVNLIPDSIIILSKLKDLTSVPTTFFVDANGRQVGEMYVGARSKDEWISIIENTLANLP